MGEWIDFAAVKAAVRMEKLLEEYGIKPGRRIGMCLRGRCPLPQHRSRGSGESFMVNTQKNVWACHSQSCVVARGGQRGGNVLDFVAAMENCSIAQAARRLRARWGVGGGIRPLEAGTGFKKKEGRTAGSAFSRARDRNPPLGFVLGPVDGGHPYLRQRGIDRQTAECFQAGFYGGVGMMQERLVIAIHNRRGQLVAYVGRAIDGRPPRYKFPPGFQKSLELFNLHRALGSGSGQVLVVEGFFDCMQVHQAGFPSVVGLMGAWLSRVQQQLLREHFQEVVLMLDGDETGRRASQRIAAQLSPQMAVRVVEVPLGRQPDQLTPMEIRGLLESARKC